MNVFVGHWQRKTWGCRKWKVEGRSCGRKVGFQFLLQLLSVLSWPLLATVVARGLFWGPMEEMGLILPPISPSMTSWVAPPVSALYPFAEKGPKRRTTSATELGLKATATRMRLIPIWPAWGVNLLMIYWICLLLSVPMESTELDWCCWLPC